MRMNVNQCEWIHWFSIICVIWPWTIEEIRLYFYVILDDSHSFLMILANSCQFSNNCEIDSWWFSLILKSVWNWFSPILDSWRFSQILNDFQWFSPILADSQISLELILVHSWISLNLILIDSQWFSPILDDSCWFLNKSGIDSWISLKIDSHWFSMILTDSHQFSVILADYQWFLLILK